MNIEFHANVNHPYCDINLARFCAKDGTVFAIDRQETACTVNGNNLDMIWYGCYLWEIDNETPFTSEEASMKIYPDSRLLELLEEAKLLSLDAEDDAEDTDYEAKPQSWKIVFNQNLC